MEHDHPAARAAAATHARKRPQSRASSNSVHSITTQPNMEQSSFGDVTDMYTGQWGPTDHAHPKGHGAAPQMSPEDLILQAASHIQGPGQHDFSMDGSMGPPMGHAMPYHQHQHHTHQQQQQQPHPHQNATVMARNSISAQSFGGNASFTDGDSQMMDREDQEEGDSINMAAGAEPKSASARSSANNELEMRQLFGANRHRTLQEVAGDLHGDERGPNSERTRQVFAMLWINSVCSKGKGSVPRGRVYANYASRCATERITVLNPASFGKLVRVLFPGLKTRRLGVRGESKYHYVNFTLVDDQPSTRDSPAVPRMLSEPKLTSNSPNNSTSQTTSRNLPRRSPSPKQSSSTRAKHGRHGSGARSHSLFNQPDLTNIDQIHSTAAKTALELSFPSATEDRFEQSSPLDMPDIEPFLPPSTDADAAKSLSALYRSHCTSLIECIRYCREKTFFHLYTSFQGTLTMPVQKLFGKAEVAPWIEQCDMVLYQRMMKIISGLTLQVVPKPVLDTLRSIAERLVPHIRDSFQGQPQHVIQAKEGPATLFAGLLDRALRVNLTAHAAANMLSNPANRDQMYVDWITMIRARKVAECVPTRGMDDVVHILINEMRDLLDPVNVPWEVECLTLYGDVASRSGRQADVEASNSDSGHNVLDRWVAILRDLPNRFPYASHVDLVWCVERVGTAVMRDLTLSQGKSFGSWWVTKTWIDEMVCFLAEEGGFLKQTSSQNVALPVQTQTANKETQQHSRGGSGEDLELPSGSQTQPGRAPFPPPPSTMTSQGGNNNNHSNNNDINNNNHNHNNHAQNSLSGNGGDLHDDSGIGIRTPEEDFPMDKFSFAGNEHHALATGAGLPA